MSGIYEQLLGWLDFMRPSAFMNKIDEIYSPYFAMGITVHNEYSLVKLNARSHKSVKILSHLMVDPINQEIVSSIVLITLLMPININPNSNSSIYDTQLMSLMLLLDEFDHNLALPLAEKMIARDDLHFAKMIAIEIANDINHSNSIVN